MFRSMHRMPTLQMSYYRHNYDINLEVYVPAGVLSSFLGTEHTHLHGNNQMILKDGRVLQFSNRNVKDKPFDLSIVHRGGLHLLKTWKRRRLHPDFEASTPDFVQLIKDSIHLSSAVSQQEMYRWHFLVLSFSLRRSLDLSSHWRMSDILVAVEDSN